MTRATLRTTAGDAAVQQTAVAAAKPAAAPAAAAVKPGVIQTRAAAPAVRVTTAATAPAAAAPIRQVRARTTPAAAPAPTTAQPNVTTAPAHKTAPALAPRAGRAAKNAPIDVQATVVQTPTPVAGVTVESVNTAAAPAASVEDALLGDPNQAAVETAAVETAAAGEAEAVDAGPVAPEDQEPAAPAAPVTQALAPRPPMSVSRQMFTEQDGITGDWTSDDLKFPRLQIVRGSGELSQNFNDGTLLYSDIPLLPPPSLEAGAQNPVLYFAPILINKGFREVLTEEEQNAGQLPRNASSRQEVEALGGTVRWVGGQKPNWAPSSACVLMIEKPEGSEHPGFSLPLDGRDYAVALFFVSGKDHGLFADLIVNTAKQVLQVPILGADKQPLKDDAGRVQKRILLYKNFWTLQYTRDTSGKYPTWRPQIRLSAKEETGAEVREYIENLFGGGAVASQAAE